MDESRSGGLASANGRDRSIRPRWLAVAALVIAAGALLAPRAHAGTPMTVHIVPDPSGATDTVVDLTTKTYAQAVTALSGAASATIPVTIPGFVATTLTQGQLSQNPTNHALMITGSATLPVASAFGAADPVPVALTAVWPDGSSTEPRVAVAVQRSDVSLRDLNRLWSTPVEGAIPHLPSATVLLTGSTFSFDPSVLPTAGNFTFPAGAVALAPGETLDASIDLTAYPALQSAASLLGFSGSTVPVTGLLSASAAPLFDQAAGGTDADLSALDLSAAFSPLSLPSWMGSRSATVALTLGAAPAHIPGVRITDDVTVTAGGTTNTFHRSVGLAEGKQLTAALTANDPFQTPFGLDWLQLSSVQLDLSVDTASHVISGHLGATLTMGTSTPHVDISVDADPSAHTVAGTVSVTGDVSLPDFVAFLQSAPGSPFAGASPSLDGSAMSGVVLHSARFSLSAGGGTTTLALSASATIRTIDVNVALSVQKETAKAPVLFLGLDVAPSSTDASCSCIRLGSLLGMPASVAGRLELGSASLVLIQPADTATASLPQTVQDYLATRYGTDVPTTFDGSVNVAATVLLDGLGDTARQAIGYAPGSTVKLEGSLKLDLGELDAGHFDPSVAGFKLTATLPSVTGPQNLPSWLHFPPAQVTLSVEYANENNTKSLKLTAAGHFTSDLQGDNGPFAFDVTASFEASPPSFDDPKVTFDGKTAQGWSNAFGITWLDLTSVGVHVQIAHTDTATTVDASLTADFAISGKHFAVAVSGKLGDASPAFDATLSFNDSLSVGEVLNGIFGQTFGVPSQLTSASFGPATIQVSHGDDKTTVAALATAGFKLTPGATNPISGTLLFSDDTAGNFTFGVRPNGPLNLSDLLPGVHLPTDIPLVGADSSGPAFGILVSNQDRAKVQSDKLDDLTRSWLKPLYGVAATDTKAFEVNLPSGLSFIGHITLPDDVKNLVTSSLGMAPDVELTGTLPLFGDSHAINLSLAMHADAAHLPDWIKGAGLSLSLSATAGSESTVSISLSGNLTVRFKSGLPDGVASTLAAAGITVDRADPVAPNATCSNGSTPEGESGTGAFYCYDELTFSLTAGLDVQATPPKIEGTLTGDLTSSNGPWHPFGVKFLGIQQLRLQLGLKWDSTQAAPGITVDFGFFGSVTLNGKALDLAGKVGITPLFEPPFVEVDFQGFSAGISSLSLQDLVDLQNQIAAAGAQAAGQPVPPKLTLGNMPNVELRDARFSLSPQGVPDLCIKQGVLVQADLYVNPAGLAPPPTPRSCPLQGNQPPPGATCVQNRANGCFANILLSVSDKGLIANGSVAPFDLGPVHFGGAEIDLAATSSDQHLKFNGAVTISDPTNPQNTLGSGRLALSLKPTDFQFYGRLQVFGFGVLADGHASLDVVNNPSPSLFLHVLLASSNPDATFGQPDFGTQVVQAAAPLISTLKTVDQIAQGVLDDLKTGDPVNVLRNLPARLTAAGIPVPQWLSDLVHDFATVLAPLGNAVHDGIDIVLNGFTIPAYAGNDIGYVTLCYADVGNHILGTLGLDGGCWKRIPFVIAGHTLIDGDPGTFVSTCAGTEAGPEGDKHCYSLGLTPHGPITTGGLCGVLFPGLAQPCTLEGVIDHEILPFFQGVVNQIVPGLGNLDFDTLLDQFKQTLNGHGSLLSFQCAEFQLDINNNNRNDTELKLAASIFGRPLDLDLAFDFNDPAGSAKNLITAFFTQLINPQPVTCTDFDETVFADSDVVSHTTPPPPTLGLQLQSAAIDEGQTATATGTFTPALTGDRSVKVEWGDGTSDTVTEHAGTTSFGLTHAYPDDNPTGTASDVYPIEMTDTGTGGSSASAALTVRNVAPVVTALSLSAPTVPENATETLTVAFTDPGAGDTHHASVDWGDGTVVDTPVPAGARSLTIDHVYADDNPTSTASDPATIRVQVFDDDLGMGTGSTPVTIANVAPSGISMVPNRVDEGQNVNYTVTFADPGGQDTHTVNVDWGDGTPAGTATLAAGVLQVQLPHIYTDDNPSGTPSDQIHPAVTVTDDDTGSLTTASTVTVDNVNPSDVHLAMSPATIDENGSATLAGTFADPGTADTHSVKVEWGDGSSQTVPVAPGSRQFSLSHQYLDDNPTGTAADTYMVKATVTDDDTGSAAATTPVVVRNVNPVVASGADVTIDEAGTVTVHASFTDAGTKDTHVATIDWGDGTGPHAAPVIETNGSGTVTLAHQYGDNGAYTVTVAVTDDDTGVGASHFTATVNNINPTSVIDRTATVAADGGNTFITRAGQPVTMADRSTDPGSDDLSFLWTWGDGTTAAGGPYLVNAPATDPALSPSVQPRNVTDSKSHSWSQPCLYAATVGVTDDDRGAGSDSVPVVVTGTNTVRNGAGYWYNQAKAGVRNSNDLSDATIGCYLAIVNHMSRVFNQVNDVSTLARAEAALKGPGSDPADQLDRALLTAWLNFSDGSIQWSQMVDTNGDGKADTAFSQVMANAERVRLDKSSTATALRAQKAILETVTG